MKITVHFKGKMSCIFLGVQCLPQAGARVHEDRSFICKIVWLDVLIVMV